MRGLPRVVAGFAAGNRFVSFYRRNVVGLGEISNPIFALS
jgi:hypothetical protein